MSVIVLMHHGLVFVDLGAHSSRRRQFFPHYDLSISSWKRRTLGLLNRFIPLLFLFSFLFFVLEVELVVVNH